MSTGFYFAPDDAGPHVFAPTSWAVASSGESHDVRVVAELDASDPAIAADFAAMSITGMVPLCLEVGWSGAPSGLLDSYRYADGNVEWSAGTRAPHALEPRPADVPAPRWHTRRGVLRPASADIDDFLGRRELLQVRGEPRWIHSSIRAVCRCARDTRFVAALGYGTWAPGDDLLGADGFFIGEWAHYYFWCAACARMVIASSG